MVGIYYLLSIVPFNLLPLPVLLTSDRLSVEELAITCDAGPEETWKKISKKSQQMI
jgi:hypothetical protein